MVEYPSAATLRGEGPTACWEGRGLSVGVLEPSSFFILFEGLLLPPRLGAPTSPGLLPLAPLTGKPLLSVLAQSERGWEQLPIKWDLFREAQREDCSSFLVLISHSYSLFQEDERFGIKGPALVGHRILRSGPLGAEPSGSCDGGGSELEAAKSRHSTDAPRTLPEGGKEGNDGRTIPDTAPGTYLGPRPH